MKTRTYPCMNSINFYLYLSLWSTEANRDTTFLFLLSRFFAKVVPELFFLFIKNLASWNFERKKKFYFWFWLHHWLIIQFFCHTTKLHPPQLQQITYYYPLPRFKKRKEKTRMTNPDFWRKKKDKWIWNVTQKKIRIFFTKIRNTSKQPLRWLLSMKIFFKEKKNPVKNLRDLKKF